MSFDKTLQSVRDGQLFIQFLYRRLSAYNRISKALGLVVQREELPTVAA